MIVKARRCPAPGRSRPLPVRGVTGALFTAPPAALSFAIAGMGTRAVIKGTTVMRNAMLWVVGALLLAACSSSPSIPDFQAKQPLKVESGARARPVRFGNVIVEVPRGTIVGEEMGAAITGQKDVDAALADMESRVNELLANL